LTFLIPDKYCSMNRNIDLSTIELNTSPGNYIASEPLIQAVEIAVALNKPLVISGEPGTGKTQLAFWVAHQLASQTQADPYPFIASPLVFNTKSGSSAMDLFYYYDVVSHFRCKDDPKPQDYIEVRGMGLAILLAHGAKCLQIGKLGELPQFKNNDAANGTGVQANPRSTVVLIDEIDKAPRDFPNDLLHEMENYSFEIREMGLTVPRPQAEARIIVIMTSNSEKNLPNAFLRRCVFYHIPFPGKTTLLEITKARMKGTTGDAITDEVYGKAIDQFIEYRKLAISKKPATSEFLDWLHVLDKFGLLKNGNVGTYDTEEENDLYDASLSALFKSKEDITRFSRQPKTA
jgi:MoxR-like ATPase